MTRPLPPGRRAFRRIPAAAGLAALLLCPSLGLPAQSPPRLLLAFASFRDRPLHPRVYFYELDGQGAGKLLGHIPGADLLVDTRPSLARGGRWCVCASELENNPSNLRVWDREEGKDVESPAGLNTEIPEISPSVSADGRAIAFAAWRREGGAGGWDIFVYDAVEGKATPLASNTDEDEQGAAISADGRLVAFVSSRPGGAGSSDVYLFDRAAGKLVPLPGLNTARREIDPSLNADGRLIAFTSDRPGGAGSRDVYLYDRRSAALVPLPGLNGIGFDHSPALSADGRYLAFVAERASGEGEGDIYLYDRTASKLVPLPGCNSKAEDFDPAVCLVE